MILIVGLGNPNMCGTRHNIGADVLRIIFHLTKRITQFNDFVCFIIPDTMNISGKNIKKVYDQYNCKKLIILHDELDLELGKIKVSGTGTNGHNGLKSVKLYFDEFIRIRIGVGRPISESVSEFVLNKFSEDELVKIPFLHVKETLFEIINKD